MQQSWNPALACSTFVGSDHSGPVLGAELPNARAKLRKAMTAKTAPIKAQIGNTGPIRKSESLRMMGSWLI